MNRFSVPLIAARLIFSTGCEQPDEVERPTALSETPEPALVVERVVEGYVAETGDWVPVSREIVVVEHGQGFVRGIMADGIARFRLTIRDPSLTPSTYSVLVTPECFDAVRVGFEWPGNRDLHSMLICM